MKKGSSRLDPIRDVEVLKRLKAKNGQSAYDLYNKERSKSKGNPSIFNQILTEGNRGGSVASPDIKERVNNSNKRKNLYNARKVTLPTGEVFDSTWEYNVWNRLLILQKTNVIFNLQRQVVLTAEINNIKICAPTLDFTFRVKYDSKCEDIHREARRVNREGFVDIIADAKSKQTGRARGWTLISKLVWALYSKPVVFYQDDNDVESVVYKLAGL